MKLATKNTLRSMTHSWKDLILLVLGIYLALWMENSVQDWEDNNKQQDYLYRLAQDLKSDIQSMEYLLKEIGKKSNRLENAIAKITQGELDVNQNETIEFTLTTASIVNNYYFFTPQDFTYLSMRESGDFKLIRDDSIKSQLIELYGDYELLDTLQKNYLQGLDDEFIPLWLRSVDVLNNTLVNKELIHQPLYTNMIAFAYNETQQREAYIKRLLEQTKRLEQVLLKTSHPSEP